MLHAEQLALRALMLSLGLGVMARGWFMKRLEINDETNLPDLCLCGYD
jgi:hypothetical protein